MVGWLGTTFMSSLALLACVFLASAAAFASSAAVISAKLSRGAL